MLHQTLGITRNTLERVLTERRSFRDNLRQIRSVYLDITMQEKEAQEAQEAQEEAKKVEVVKVERVALPDPDTSRGVGIELKYVIFHR